MPKWILEKAYRRYHALGLLTEEACHGPADFHSLEAPSIAAPHEVVVWGEGKGITPLYPIGFPSFYIYLIS